MSFATSHSAGASPSETVRVCDNFKVCFGDNDDGEDNKDDTMTTSVKTKMMVRFGMFVLG